MYMENRTDKNTYTLPTVIIINNKLITLLAFTSSTGTNIKTNRIKSFMYKVL